MDVLTDVLGAMRLSGGVFLEAEFTAPWGVRSQISPEDCRPFFDQPSHLIAYHFVTSGGLLCEVEGSPVVQAEAGDILLLTRNDPHILANTRDVEIAEARQLLEPPDESGLARVRWGGGGERTTMFCGFIGTESPMASILMNLPSLLKVSTPEGARRQWLISSLHYAAADVRAQSAGIARLVELLFAEAVQQYANGLPAEDGGWFAALRDPAIGQALRLIHDRYAEEWTSDGLARAVGMSRSAFAARFGELLGEPPMRYCARWRMQIAANMLRDEQQNVSNVAYHVGFNSEAAFSRAFKREYGVPPAAWRRGATAPAGR